MYYIDIPAEQAPFIKEVTTKLETFIASEEQSFEIDR